MGQFKKRGTSIFDIIKAKTFKAQDPSTGQSFYSDSAGNLGVGVSTYHDSPSPANSDVITIFAYYGNNSAGEKIQYGGMLVTATTTTDSSEAGTISWTVYDPGTQGNVSKMTISTLINGVIIGDGTSASVIQTSLSQPLNLVPSNSAAVNIPNGTFSVSALTLTADDSASATNSIIADAVSINISGVTNDANDFVVLPAIADVEIGHTIYIACNASSNFELRTPAASTTTINGVNSDGTQEYLCTDTDLIRVTKVTATGWVAQSITSLGAVRTAVVPD